MAFRDHDITAAVRPVKRHGDATGALLISESTMSEITELRLGKLRAAIGRVSDVALA